MALFDNPRKDGAWKLILFHRPQDQLGHDSVCPGLTDRLQAHRSSCPDLPGVAGRGPPGGPGAGRRGTASRRLAHSLSS